MAGKVFGQATVKVDGATLLIDRDAALDFGGVKRNVVKGTIVQGYAEEAMEASVDVKATIDSKASLAQWAAINAATVTFEMDTGQVYSLANAWLEEPPKATGGDGGKVPLKFVSDRCEEIS